MARSVDNGSRVTERPASVAGVPGDHGEGDHRRFLHACIHEFLNQDSFLNARLQESCSHAGSTESILRETCRHAIDFGMVIVYFGVKGGGGKTSLSVSHAGWLFDLGERVAFLDADRQQLGSFWMKKAEPGMTVACVSTPLEVQRKLATLLHNHAIVVVDCPGGFDRQNVALLQHADLVAIPVMASPLDVHSAFSSARQLVRAVCRKHRVRPEVRFVVNGLDDRTKFAREMRDFQMRMDPPATMATVRRLAGLVNATNRTFPTRLRQEPAARADLESLFNELMDVATRSVAGKEGRL